jgi:hypothetical protein
MTEEEFSEIVMRRLSIYFDIYPEQWSKDRKSRIDYIIICKETGMPFGFEFKRLNHKRGVNLGEHIIQSMRYVSSEFNVNGKWQRIPVVICPPISYTYLMCPVPESMMIGNSAFSQSSKREYFHDRHDKNHEHHTVNGMLGALGIGELRTTMDRGKKIFYISFCNKPLWEEKSRWNSPKPKGLHEKNYNFQINKPLQFLFL